MICLNLILSLIVKANVRENCETDRDLPLTPCPLPHQLLFPFHHPVPCNSNAQGPRASHVYVPSPHSFKASSSNSC